MVFESVVVNLVNTYLGRYIKDLDSSNLDLSIWRGDVVLNNLTLKDDALAELDLPIQVKSGNIGKLSAEIPWSNIYTKPVVVNIEDVFILAAPITEIDYDEKGAEECLRAAKRRRLQAIDKSSEPLSHENPEESQLSDSYTFVEKLTAQIVKNLQIFIKNIHIRYEDKITTPGSSFAIGLTLKHLTAETTDEYWKPCVVEATKKTIFKFISLDSFAVYWNTNINESQYGGSKDWKSSLRSDIRTKEAKNDDYEYVLEPFSLEAHVEIDQNSAMINNKPKITVEVIQHDMILSLSRSQFQNLVHLIESFELMIANEPYKKYRPNVPLRNNAKIWWKYAITAIVKENIRTWSWQNIRRHRSLYHEYKNVYKTKLLYDQRGIKNVSTSFKSKIHDIEDELQLSSILIAREHALAEFKTNPGIYEDVNLEETSSGWWNWIFGSNETNYELSEEIEISSSLSLSALSPSEKQRLYDALDYSENVEDTKYPKEYVKYVLLFSLERFEVHLMNELRRNLSFVSMSGVSGSVQHRPSSSNTSFNLDVNDIILYGHGSKLDDEALPKLLYLQTREKDSHLAFFEFSFELNPIHVSADYSVFLKLEPVKIVHDTNTVMQFVNFFNMPQSRALQELTEVASLGIIEIQNRTRAGLEYAVSQQTIFYFDVNLKAPCIVVPEFGAMEKPGSVFIVDFGHLTIKTDLNSKQSLIQDATESELENMLCDNFDVSLSDMQVLIASKDDDWLSAHAQSSSPFHLLPSSEITLEIRRNTNSVYSSLPENTMKGTLPRLEIKLSEEKYRQLMQFISNLPLLTEPLDDNEKYGLSHTTYPVTLSRHSSRMSLVEASDIQIMTREALTVSSEHHDGESFYDAEEKFIHIDDDEEWVLAPDYFEEKDPEIDKERNNSGTEKHPKANKIKLSAEFSIEKVFVAFNRFIQTVDEPYICLEINELSSNICVMQYEMTVSAKLGSVHLTDYLFRDVDSGPLVVLSSIAEKELISLFYRKVDSNCPYMDESFDGVQCLIKTEFNALNILLHREGITTFQNFILSLIERSEKPNFHKLGERVTSYLEVIPEGVQLDVVALNSEKNDETPAPFEKTTIETTLDEVHITFSANNEHFSLTKIKGLRVDSFLEDKQTHIKARLEYFTVENITANTSYNKILTVDDGNLCDFEATIYSKTKRTNPTSVDMDVRCRFGRLKFVFLHKFVSEIQEFFASFASPETRQYAQNATTQAVQMQVEQLQKMSPKIGLKVDISAPVIKIPLNAISNDGIIIDLGSLVIRNKLEEKETSCGGIKNRVLTDNIKITLESFNVIRFNPADSWTGTHNLVDPTGLDIALSRCIHGLRHQMPATEIEAVLRQLTTSVDESDFKLLIGIWVENIQHTLLQETYEDGSVDELSQMPEAEQHLITFVDGPIKTSQDVSSEVVNMKICAVIEYVSLQFPRAVNKKRLPYLEFNAQKLKTEVTFSENNTFGSASLGDLFLIDYSSFGSLIKPLSVLESSRNNDLITVQFQQELSQSTPQKKTQRLDVLATIMKLHFEERSILGIQDLLKSFTESLKVLNNPAGHELDECAQDGKNSPEQVDSDTEDDLPKGSDNMKLTVVLDKLEVILSRKERQIVGVIIEDVYTEVVIDDEKCVVISRQKGLSVTDLDPLSNYSNVISIEADRLFDFEYRTLPSTVTSTNREKFLTTPHSQLSLNIGKIRFVFLYKLLTDIQAFFQSLVSRETTSYSYELAQKTVQEQLENIETQGTKIALKLSIAAPLVILPSHSRATDCLIIDLGCLNAKNQFILRKNMDNADNEVVVDKIDFDLESVQLSRGVLDLDSNTMARRLLMNPLKMTLVIMRSMKSEARWLPYLSLEIGLDHVEMRLDEADYQLLVSAMQQNYAESHVVFDSTSGLSSGDVFVGEPKDYSDTSRGLVQERTIQVEQNTVWDTTVVVFAFSGLSLSLYNDENDTKLSKVSFQLHRTEKTLCTCELQKSNGTVTVRSDSSIDLRLYLYGCIIEDARPSKMTAFPRMLSHKTEQKHGRRSQFKSNNKNRPSMIEVSYKQTPVGQMIVDLTMQDPVLYISFPLLWSLLDFFAVNSNTEAVVFNDAGTTLSQSTGDHDSQSSAYVLEVNGALNNPEIVLLGEPENPSSSALIVQTSIEFEYKLVDNQQNFSTTSKDLIVHSCRYPDREKTLYKVVKPCAIDFRYSYPGSDCEGQEINLCVPQMTIKASPLLLKTLLAIYQSFYGDQEITEERTPQPDLNVDQNVDLWRPQPICKDDWKQDRAPVRLPSRIHLNTTVTEKLSLEMKSVRLTLYNEVMGHRVPLLLMNSSVVFNLKDWSSELKLVANLSLEAWYYNETFAAWEPLMESEETLNERHLWQLELKIFKADSHSLSFTPDSEEQKLIDKEDFRSLASSHVIESSSPVLHQRSPVQFATPDFDQYRSQTSSDMLTRGGHFNVSEIRPLEIFDDADSYLSHRSPLLSECRTDVSSDIPQATYIVLSSEDIMQLTVTRPAVDVLTEISVIFADVTSAAPSETDVMESPFVVVNDLGINTSVSLSYRHETIQKSTPELTITKRNRMGYADGYQDTSKSYPAGLYKLDTPRDKTGVSMLSKDDSVIQEDQDDMEGEDCIAYVHGKDGEIKVTKEKKFTRSISMPAKDMRTMVKLVEEKERKRKNPVKRLVDVVAEKHSPEAVETTIHESEEVIVPEMKLGIDLHDKDTEREPKDGEDAVRFDKKPKNERSSEAKKRVILDNIDEDSPDGEKKHEENNEAETSGNEQAPSFISGAFATMGLIAGISGHPISSADQLIGQPAEEKKEVLFERPEYKKADDYISIQIAGFDELSFVPVSRAGRFLYQLYPKKRGRYCYIVVQIEIEHSQKRVTIRAPLQVKNNLDVAIDLIEENASKEGNDRKICTIQPKEVGNLPLFNAHKEKFFLKPAAIDGFKKSTTWVSWQHLSDEKQTSIVTCLPEEAGPNYAFCVKVLCERDSLNIYPSRTAPHHILQLYPTISFGNFLPFSVTLKHEDSDVEIMNIEPGKRHQLTCVTTNKQSTFLLKVEQYMKTSWSGLFKLGGDSQPDLLIEMQPERDVYNKLFIRFEYIDKGSLGVNFYSSYWMVNKTNLSIAYRATKSSSETYKQMASDTEPLLFESSNTKKIMLKLHGCDWSKSFSLDALGNAGDLVCEEIKTSREYEMAISIELSSNRLTKILTIMPKFVIINKTERVLSICETGQKDGLWIIIKPNQCVPYWPITKSNAFLVKLSDSMLTSKVIRMDSLFPAIFRVGHGVLLEMNTEITESSTTIVFTQGCASNLPRLENLCEDISIKLHQKDSGTTTVLLPLTSIVYLWDEPGGDLTLLWQPENYHNHPENIPLNKDGFGHVKLRSKKKKSSSIGCMGRRSRRLSEPVTQMEPPESRRKSDREFIVGKTIYWMSFLDGFQRVVTFTDDPIVARETRKQCEGEPVTTEIFLSLDGVRLSVVNQEQSEIIYLGISSATSIWEVEKSPKKWRVLNVETSSILEEAWRNNFPTQKLAKDVEVDFDTMTLIKPYRGSLNRRCEPGLWIHYSASLNYESFSAKIHRVQIDNQIFGTIFPCALYPSPLPSLITQRYGFKPFFELSAIYRNDTKHNFLHLRYFKVLIQEMNIKLEKEFLRAIYNLIYGDDTSEQDAETLFNQDLRNMSLTLEDTLIKSGSLDTHRLFLEVFHLSPLKVNLSLSLRSGLYQSEKHGDSDLFQVLINSVGSPLTEVNDVLIKLAYFERAGLFITENSLISSAKKHYTWQALRQFHAIALGLDVLGNPYGLLTDIGEGVKDLFYEPYQGIVLGPQEFATGLARGVKSLLGHAIGGTAGAMSKITGTFGQAFASLSFDEDYRMKRRLRMANGPASIQEGVAMGGKSFLMGLVFGVSGVVTKPIQGARADGVEGFFKGFGKGIMGLVTRPTVGVFDMVSTTLDGIRRSAEQDGEDVVVRMRMPRFSPPDAPLRPYLEYQANGNAIMKSLPWSREIIRDVYIDHTPLPKDGNSSIVIFTNMRILEVHQTAFWSEWKINEDIKYDDISGSVKLSLSGMEICTKTDSLIRIESTDLATLQMVQRKLEEHLYHYRTAH
ncbi:vacuolar protein sorting-associated protein 13C-like [Dendronephthya gigantea]|uniref:vacuolar protein sorting-associated protein 13C-like n=1 Tax=Dendronephthya gigantea TaxID=151771 RepID=UPI00106C6A09|nr:vacuolar protein sorting-associated protein 13C-like [Dendronephthya gigantea]